MLGKKVVLIEAFVPDSRQQRPTTLQKGKGIIWLPFETVRVHFKRIFDEYKAADDVHGIYPLGDSRAVQFRSKADIRCRVKTTNNKKLPVLKLENLMVLRISHIEIREGKKGILLEVEVHLTESEASCFGRVDYCVEQGSQETSG